MSYITKQRINFSTDYLPAEEAVKRSTSVLQIGPTKMVHSVPTGFLALCMRQDHFCIFEEVLAYLSYPLRRNIHTNLLPLHAIRVCLMQVREFYVGKIL